MTNDTLIAVAPFHGLPVISGAGHGVIATGHDGLGLATVLARKGQMAALCERTKDLFGIELPQGTQYVSAGRVAFVGTGPGAWLAMQEGGSDVFAASLQGAIGDLASISDQSDGYAVVRLTGPKLLDTLAKLLPIDIHRRAFAPGATASTVASHVGVTLWRLEDAEDGSPTFELAVFRSLAAGLWHALTEAAAEFGP